jgi:selenocysteine lyase/cysteine desulfurase
VFTAEELAEIRAAFPALSQRLELNTGTKGLTAAPVVESMLVLARQTELGGYAAYAEMQGKARLARHRIAKLLNVGEDELALTGNATDSLNIAAMSLRWDTMRPTPGRPVEVLISDHEYPTTNMLFHYLEQMGKIRLIRYVLSADIEEMLASLNQNVTDETRVMVISHVDCNTGLLFYLFFWDAGSKRDKSLVKQTRSRWNGFVVGGEGAGESVQNILCEGFASRFCRLC